MEILPELNHNPFKDRISYVFSSQKDDCFSFEDILDLASAFSENCPIEVRAKWAFLIYGKQCKVKKRVYYRKILKWFIQWENKDFMSVLCTFASR